MEINHEELSNVSLIFSWVSSSTWSMNFLEHSFLALILCLHPLFLVMCIDNFVLLVLIDFAVMLLHIASCISTNLKWFKAVIFHLFIHPRIHPIEEYSWAQYEVLETGR